MVWCKALPFVLFAEPSPAYCCPDRRPLVSSVHEGRQLLQSARILSDVAIAHQWDPTDLPRYFARLVAEYYEGPTDWLRYFRPLLSDDPRGLAPVVQRLGRWLECGFGLDLQVCREWGRQYPLTIELRPDCMTEWDWWQQMRIPLRRGVADAVRCWVDEPPVVDMAGDWRISAVTVEHIEISPRHSIGGSPIAGSRFRTALVAALDKHQ